VLILLAGGIAYKAWQQDQGLTKGIKRLGIIGIILLVGFFYFIALSRVAEGQEFSLGDNFRLINEYYSSSIPAFCAWVDQNHLPWLNFDIGQFSILREVAGFLQLSIERTIDHQVVNIPHPFNVFTGLADSIAAFGYLGSLLYFGLMGWFIGMIDVKTKGDHVIFLFASFFLFAVYSLFTDIYFYMIGSWICLAFHFIFRINEKQEFVTTEEHMKLNQDGNTSEY
jgi:oligosaccharide repeat unit polymerase